MPRNRGGFFRRILDAVKDFFEGAPEDAGQSPSPIPSPEPPQRESRRYEDVHERRMWGIWNDVPHRRGVAGYAEWREIFDNLQLLYDDDQEEERFWEQFLDAFYPWERAPKEVWQRRRDQFYRDTGLPDSAVDWDAWRRAINSP